MVQKSTTVAAKSLAVLAALMTASAVALAAEPAAGEASISPISGQGAGPKQHVLYSSTLGDKQAVSYFLSEAGACRMTLMVGSAFNGEDVPDLTTVRFEAVVDAGRSVRFGTADGRALEFTCKDGASSMQIRASERLAAYAP